MKYTEINFKSLNSDFPKTSKKSGVYVWGYNRDGRFVPLYVGTAAKLYDRAFHHYCGFKSGLYCVFDLDEHYKVLNSKLTDEVKKVYEPLSLSDVVNIFPNIFEKHVKPVINSFVFRYIEMEDTVERYRAESLIADEIGTNVLISQVDKSKDYKTSQELINIIS